MLVSMNYLPQAERLTVVIVKAKNLDTDQIPYVKVNFMNFSFFFPFSFLLFFLSIYFHPSDIFII